MLQAGAMLQFQQGVNEYYSLGCALNPYNVPDDNCLKLSKTITNYIYGAGYVIWKTTQIGNANPAISGDVSKKGENIRVRFNGNGKIEIFDNAEMTGTPVIILQIDNTSRTVSEFYFFRDGIKIKDSSNTNNYLTVVSFPYTNASNVPPTIVNYVFIETKFTVFDFTSGKVPISNVISEEFTKDSLNKLGLVFGSDNNLTLNNYIKIPAKTVIKPGGSLQIQQSINEYYSLILPLNNDLTLTEPCLKVIKSTTSNMSDNHTIWKTINLSNFDNNYGSNIERLLVRVYFNSSGKIQIYTVAEPYTYTGPIITLEYDSTVRNVDYFYLFGDSIKIKDSNNNYLSVVTFPYTNTSTMPPKIIPDGVNGITDYFFVSPIQNYNMYVRKILSGGTELSITNNTTNSYGITVNYNNNKNINVINGINIPTYTVLKRGILANGIIKETQLNFTSNNIKYILKFTYTCNLQFVSMKNNTETILWNSNTYIDPSFSGNPGAYFNDNGVIIIFKNSVELKDFSYCKHSDIVWQSNIYDNLTGRTLLNLGNKTKYISRYLFNSNGLNMVTNNNKIFPIINYIDFSDSSNKSSTLIKYITACLPYNISDSGIDMTKLIDSKGAQPELGGIDIYGQSIRSYINAGTIYKIKGNNVGYRSTSNASYNTVPFLFCFDYNCNLILYYVK